MERFFISKVGRVFTMVIWPEIRLGQYRDGDNREDALRFMNYFDRKFIKNDQTNDILNILNVKKCLQQAIL